MCNNSKKRRSQENRQEREAYWQELRERPAGALEKARKTMDVMRISSQPLPEKKLVAIRVGAPGDENAQLAALAKAKQFSPEELESYARILSVTERSNVVPNQENLFGFDNSAIREAEAVAKEIVKQIEKYREHIKSVEGAIERPDVAKEMGLIFVKSEDSIRNEVNLLKKKIDRLNRINTNLELYNKMRRRVGLEPKIKK